METNSSRYSVASSGLPTIEASRVGLESKLTHFQPGTVSSDSGERPQHLTVQNGPYYFKVAVRMSRTLHREQLKVDLGLDVNLCRWCRVFLQQTFTRCHWSFCEA